MKREDWGNPYNEDTAAVYNANCKKGEDPAFGKVFREAFLFRFTTERWFSPLSIRRML